MASTFSLILVVVTILTGIIWTVDKLVWAKQRAAKVAVARANGAEDAKSLAKLAERPVWVEQTGGVFPVIALVLILRSFVYEPFQIPSGSMMPTLLVGDFILVEKFAYGLRDPVTNTKFLETGEPKRGDVVVFKYPLDTRVDYIKRVVGLPGDRILYRNKELMIRPRCDEGQSCGGFKKLDVKFEQRGEFTQMGIPLDRYTEQLGAVSHETLRNPVMPDLVDRYYRQSGTYPDEWVVPEGHYFVMGDNRDNSTDSRFWGFVPEQNLVGKAVAIWISFEFEREEGSLLPGWIPTGVRFNRIGAIK
ncbi:signal peptidase I [Aeromonas schubertii]|uniref:Signal peptidase I n=1 Tax=Aeromonas schubertii TaxID=652 RepID=A0ABS7VC82_9GAMM|nr:signal peptidase I [Aeromonas schubertii]KUE78339.1 S26 family signal peptidase [Aeromonas schubertii]MBZ6067002.1 signal peptidase I [Aeromonas schubertii]MBZ6073004.1 signal peptidase I [Aeromonas schubertii]QCG47159.1 signal peptidase I [Aeromonas schubertii]